MHIEYRTSETNNQINSKRLKKWKLSKDAEDRPAITSKRREDGRPTRR
jgi:hypothetical protein